MPRYKHKGAGRPKTRSKTHVIISKGIAHPSTSTQKVTLNSRGKLRNTGKPRGHNLKKGAFQGDYGRYKAKVKRKK